MGQPCRTNENHGVCPKTAALIQFSDTFLRKILHSAATAQRTGYPCRACGSILFLSPRELLGSRRLLKQDSGEFDRPATVLLFFGMMTDVGLPVMDGRELATQARMVRPTLPILFASGYAESIDVPAGMSVIGKPFSIDQLRDKVTSILASE